MTDETLRTAVKTIEAYITAGRIEFNNGGSTDYYNRLYSRICGMIEVLQIATGKQYYFDENGLHERETNKEV